MLRAASVAHGSPVVTVLAGGRPISGADILALFPNRTWKRAVTGEYGEAMLDLHAVHLPMTVFVAAEGFSAHLERGWTPAERTLHVELNALPGGGAVIFPEGAGAIPGLAGRLSPIRDTLDRTCAYADNIAVNDSRREPHSFVPGDDLRLTDADGTQRLVRILDVVGRSALVEYRPHSSSPCRPDRRSLLSGAGSKPPCLRGWVTAPGKVSRTPGPTGSATIIAHRRRARLEPNSRPPHHRARPDCVHRHVALTLRLIACTRDAACLAGSHHCRFHHIASSRPRNGGAQTGNESASDHINTP